MPKLEDPMNQYEDGTWAKPYWAELGDDYDNRTGLFHLYRLRNDGRSSHEIMLPADRLWALLRENLKRTRDANAVQSRRNR